MQAIAINGEACPACEFGVCFGMNAGQPARKFVAAHPDQEADHEYQKTSQHQRLSPVALLRAQNKHAKDDNLGNERQHPATRAGKKNTACHQRGDRHDENLAVSLGEARCRQYQWKWREHFHQAGVVIVVDIGSVNSAPLLRGPNPIELAVGRDAAGLQTKPAMPRTR